jgi:hypothetical protein
MRVRAGVGAVVAIQSFSRQTEAAFAFANALKQPAEFN